METHSSTFAWKIPWMEEPGRLQSMGSWRVGHDFTLTFNFHFHALEKEMAAHSSVLAWRIPGTGEPGGLPSMGSYRVRHDWSDLAAAVAATSLNIWHLYGISRKGKENLSDRKDYTVEWDWELHKWEWGLSYWGDRNVPKLHNNDYCTTQKI